MTVEKNIIKEMYTFYKPKEMYVLLKIWKYTLTALQSNHLKWTLTMEAVDPQLHLVTHI